jgi:hypothetical protein
MMSSSQASFRATLETLPGTNVIKLSMAVIYKCSYHKCRSYTSPRLIGSSFIVGNVSLMKHGILKGEISLYL